MNPSVIRRNWLTACDLAVRQGIKFIFYPALFYERNEFEDANNHYNCPIVTSYSENIKNNVEEIAGGEITFRNPFMSFRDLGTVTDALTKEFTEIPAAEIAAACEKGWKELANAVTIWRKRAKRLWNTYARPASAVSCWQAVPIM